MPMSNENLSDKLASYTSQDYLPMHMPGHKRNPAVVDSAFLSDITEIDGFDNFHHPDGIIEELQERAAKVWDADYSVISVNGSSGLLLSAILAASGKYHKAIVAANCHISVWHGLELAGITPVVIYPEVDPSGLYYGRLAPETLEKALKADSDVDFVIYTSPTYEGLESDTAAIHKIASHYGIPVILDEAHGAHYGLSEYFPANGNADVIIKSIHKTLNSPTQTAVLLGYGNAINRKMVNHYVDVTITTSPSYLLMAGIDRAIKDAENKDLYDSWGRITNSCKTRLKRLSHLSLARVDDLSKIVILTNGYVSGDKLSGILRDEYRIEIEASYPDYIICMTGVGDTEESLKRFTDAIFDIDSKLVETGKSSPLILPDITLTMAMSSSHAIKANSSLTDIDEAEGKISSEYLFAYPPGIPVLIPGQIISKEVTDYLTKAVLNDVSMLPEPRRKWDLKVLTVDT